MSDFTPATRNSAIWSGDSRRVAMGKANEVILTKQAIEAKLKQKNNIGVND